MPCLCSQRTREALPVRGPAGHLASQRTMIIGQCHLEIREMFSKEYHSIEFSNPSTEDVRETFASRMMDRSQ